jgi:hypothetical protein
MGEEEEEEPTPEPSGEWEEEHGSEAEVQQQQLHPEVIDLVSESEGSQDMAAGGGSQEASS